MASVDVVVPCYNYAKYLPFAVGSALSQRDVEVRVLILDDQSPDDTPQVAVQLARDPRVTYRRNTRNLGLIGTANEGVIGWASADYVVLLSADDALTPGSLARATTLMDANRDIAFTYGMALMLWDDGAPLEPHDVPDAPTQIIDGLAAIEVMFERGNLAPTPSAVLRTSVQHAIGGYDPRFQHTSDLDMWMRAARVGRVGIVNAVQGLYRWHASNMSAAFQRRPLGDRREVFETCAAFEERYRGELPDLTLFLNEAKRRISWEALQLANETLGEPNTVSADAQAFAEAINPGVRTSGSWLRLCARKMLGPSFARPAQSPTTERAWYEHGMQIGWWPQPN